MEVFNLGIDDVDAIRITDLSIEYYVKGKGLRKSKSEMRGIKAIDGVNLNIERGEIVALLGPNGAGKTTLLRAIGGDLRPKSGKIETFGRVFTLRGSNPGIIPHLTARENVKLLAGAYGVRLENLQKFEQEVEDFCELGEAYDRNYSSLSSGMAGRVGFGFTTSLEPEILLMDETLGVGDEMFRKKAEGKAIEFMNKGETIVISTHSLGLVKSMCSRGVVLNEGRVVFDGNGPDSVKYYLEEIVNVGS
jgi:ABC-type polysaccharide/polyol phosphate transport system ATPase subunit